MTGAQHRIRLVFNGLLRPSKKKQNVSLPDFVKKESGRVFFYLLYFCQLNAS